MEKRKRLQIELTDTQDIFISGYAQSKGITKSKAGAALIQEGIIRTSEDLFQDGINNSVRMTMEAVALMDQRMREDMMYELSEDLYDSLSAIRVTLTAFMLFFGGKDAPEKMENSFKEAERIVYNLNS